MKQNYKDIDISDEQLGMIVEGWARKLHTGDTDRDTFVTDVTELLTNEENVVSGSGTLTSRGRYSFGIDQEGAEGAALFVKTND